MVRSIKARCLLLGALLPAALLAQSKDAAAPRDSKGVGLWSRTSIEVPPSPRGKLDDLYPSGQLEPEGFARMVLSFQAEARAEKKGGKVGVLLVPDEEVLLDAFRSGTGSQFAIEIVVELSPADGDIASEQVEVPVAFPRYRVYFFNESGDRVLVHLFAYLTR